MNVPPAVTSGVGRAVGDVIASAAGAELRHDPIEPRTGGPAGNAKLTGWLGLLLLAGFLAECFTLLSLQAMLSAHILIGGVLIPLVVAKTGTTGWRIARYYAGAAAYRAAGPPPLLLRILGPLVVLTGLAVLGTGLALVPLGDASYDAIVTIAGQRIDALTLHKICFVLWLVATGAHVLARTVPAFQLTVGGSGRGGRVPGRTARAAVVAVTLALSIGTGIVVSGLPTSWDNGSLHGFDGRGEGIAQPRG